MRSKIRKSSHIQSRQAGFTLVELLVVIGIIAVLISILLPSLAKARVAAQKVQCAANMRQIGQFMMLYQLANRGDFPVDGQGDWWPASWTRAICPPSGSDPSVQVSNAKVFRCPLAREDVARSYALFGGAFWTGPGPTTDENTCFGRRIPLGDGGKWTGDWQIIKPSKMRSSETVMMVELGMYNTASEGGTAPWPGADNGGLPGNTDMLGGPFGTVNCMYWGTWGGPWAHEYKSSNCLFVDGHVEDVAFPAPISAGWVHIAFYEGGDMYKRLFFVDKNKTIWDGGTRD